MTQKERQKAQISRQLEALQTLVTMCGGSKYKIETINSKLRRLEYQANRDAVKYCNGDIDTEQWETLSDKYYTEVQKLFNNNLQGLKINGDARGYTLKIDDQTMRDIYSAVNIWKDWGENGILAPEITGK